MMRPRKTPDAEGDGLLATQQQSLKINSLERENLELKKLVANLSLDKEVLMSVIRKHGSTI